MIDEDGFLPIKEFFTVIRSYGPSLIKGAKFVGNGVKYAYTGAIKAGSAVKNKVGNIFKIWAPKSNLKLSANELKKIGTQANSSGIRAVKGTSSDALKFFKNQVNPSTIKEVKPGVFIGRDANGLTFTFRAASKSGPPTIDVNGIQGLRKIKFLR